MKILLQVMWVPCHHGTARPQVANGGEGLQIWTVAANILNKQSRTADKGWPSSLGVGRGLTTPHRKKRNMLRNVNKGPRNWTDTLERPKELHGLYSSPSIVRVIKARRMRWACGVHGGGEGCL
jgi:hypothetical protein